LGFLQGLREHSYVEGRNIVIEYRFSEDRNDRLPVRGAYAGQTDDLVPLRLALHRNARSSTIS
jgi:hypothetical protein